jgi:tRNA nucleotidyltransferase (CCA-adding enzyme)
MQEIGVWKFVLPEIDFDKVSWSKLKRVPLVAGWWLDRYYGWKFKTWLVYLIVIFAQLDPENKEKVLQYYPIDRTAKKAIIDSATIPQLAVSISADRLMLPSDYDRILAELANENKLYLLLCIKDESAWDRVNQYLDLKDRVRIEINGQDLRELGLKPGPAYKLILDRLYKYKLDEKLTTRREEIDMVKQWLEEGSIPNAVFI